jgi:hypothetical protein
MPGVKKPHKFSAPILPKKHIAPSLTNEYYVSPNVTQPSAPPLSDLKRI